ncbi:MAG: hypothetical protein JSU63_05035 [Phycisphaerales bacterium]|nr:MAG: hypothetical protein JSU63_05035 [Phycisphaerales bacterium]
MGYKLSLATCMSIAVCLGLAPGALMAQALDEPSVPAISDTHREFLCRVVRRTLRDAFSRRAAYEPGYVPGALDSLSLEVIVRLRQSGYLRAAGIAGPLPVVQATRDAASAAYDMLGSASDVELDLLNDFLIEIEVIGPPQAVELSSDWTQPRAVDPYIEPGIHGLVLLGPRIQHRLAPTDVFTSDMILAEILATWAKNTQSDPSQIAKTKLMRFRTAHWYQPAGSDTIVSLNRGLIRVPASAVTSKGLDECIEKIARYMAYRQLDSGLFTYQYEPGADHYTDENNLVRQVGAAAAMAAHARWSGKSASSAAAEVAIRYHLQGLVEVSSVAPGTENAAYIATADKRNKLGVTALLCIAMAEHPDAGQYAEIRKKLVNGMLWLQRPSGMFVTAFPPAERIDAQDYFPGEALLAMAMQYHHEPSAEVLQAFDSAIAFYRGFFENRPSPAFVPWQVQAYTLMSQQGKRRDYVEYVFELTDWLADKQLDPSNCKWSEMWGGIASYQEGRAGVATAAYLEGFADALVLARTIGDAQRVARYEKLVRDAARFVMQLQIRLEEAYFIRSPQDAIGGIRTTPSLNLLRIDHCQHALVGLMKAKKALFPEATR